MNSCGQDCIMLSRVCACLACHNVIHVFLGTCAQQACFICNCNLPAQEGCICMPEFCSHIFSSPSPLSCQCVAGVSAAHGLCQRGFDGEHGRGGEPVALQECYLINSCLSHACQHHKHPALFVVDCIMLSSLCSLRLESSLIIFLHFYVLACVLYCQAAEVVLIRWAVEVWDLCLHQESAPSMHTKSQPLACAFI